MEEENRESSGCEEGLFNLTMTRDWAKVVEVYRNNPCVHKKMITKTQETALHIAISSYHSKSPKAKDDAHCIDKMMEIMQNTGSLHEVLGMPNVRGDTPLHLAAAVGSAAICRRALSLLSDIMMRNKNGETPLSVIMMRNKNGETPLFVAALHGNLQAFLELNESYKEYQKTNDQTEKRPYEALRRTIDGDTVLHSAISGEYFKLAYKKMSDHGYLIDFVNENGESPLHVLARKPNVFRSTSHLRLYDSIIFNCVFVDELKDYIYDNNDTTLDVLPFTQENLPANYKTCGDAISHLWNLIKIISGRSAENESGKSKDEENQHLGENKPSNTNERRNNNRLGFFPHNYVTCILLFKVAMKIILIILGIGFGNIKKIKGKKVRYCHAMEIMNFMVDHESTYKYDNNGQQPEQKKSELALIDIDPNQLPEVDQHSHDDSHKDPNNNTTSPTNLQTTNGNKKNQKKSAELLNLIRGRILNVDKFENRSSGDLYVLTSLKQEDEMSKVGLVSSDSPVIVATKMGILEMVEQIIKKCPVAIFDMDAMGKNILMVAAEYRQSSIFDYLLKQNNPEYMYHHLDTNKNGILHLAAELERAQPWRIPGAALQMQWEYKWYKHVKNSVSQFCLTHNNAKGETPRMLFTRTHEKLVKEGSEWLTKTSESCSVIAALLAGVAFATSATVPGGLHQEKGYPLLKDRNAFDVFSITSLVALCLSITALVFFLGIITSRNEPRDFKSSLPRKLLMGLSSLFAAIITMLVSFCAGHTFILREKLKIVALPIYTFATIPVLYFAISQLPLYFDLLWAAYRKVPLRSYKMLIVIQ